MKTSRVSMLAAPALPLLGLLLVLASQEAAATGPNDDHDKDIHLISQSALLKGLSAQTVFPFVDVTPNRIRRAHIAITDSTENCAGPGSAPDNVQILVGVAGGTLVSVMTDATNTGISINPGQCVFHVTVKAGVAEIPAKVTDIVVVNAGNSPLTGVNTVTVSAEVVRGKNGGGHRH
ncbi:MAG: hypothetical protein WDZ66_12260 [Steroidobacteraceae bacterium]